MIRRGSKVRDIHRRERGIQGLLPGFWSESQRGLCLHLAKSCKISIVVNYNIFCLFVVNIILP